MVNPGGVPYRSRKHSMTWYDHGRPSIQNRAEMDEAREKKRRGPPAPKNDEPIPEDLLYLYEALRTEQDPDAQAQIEREIREKRKEAGR